MSNGQIKLHNEQENKQDLSSFDEEKAQDFEEEDQETEIIDDVKQKSANGKSATIKATPKREQTRRRREKQISSDNFQESDSFDDLDYSLENDFDFEKRSKSSHGRNRYGRSSSNSQHSRGSRSNNSSGGSSGNKSVQEGRNKLRRNLSGGTAHSGWKPEEDKRLREAIHLYGSLDWMKISNYVGNGRTRSQCSQRWHRCLDPHISKEKWSEEEIETLKRLVDEFGDRSWARIASKMDKRCDVQCRYMYKRIINKKTIRGIHSDHSINESNSKSENNSTEKVDIPIDEFESEIEREEENFVNPTPPNQQVNVPPSSIFMAKPTDFSPHQPSFAPTMMYNNAFPYPNPYMQYNPVCNNFNQNCNYHVKSIFPVSENVFSLFDIQTHSRFNQQQPFKINNGQDNAAPIQALPIQNPPPPPPPPQPQQQPQQQQQLPQNNLDMKDSDMQLFQFTDPVIKTTPIDDFMAGLSSSSSSSFSSIRYKF